MPLKRVNFPLGFRLDNKLDNRALFLPTVKIRIYDL